VRSIAALLVIALLVATGCAAAVAGRASAPDLGPVASWPPADEALAAASAAMSGLRSLREHYIAQTYRGDQLAQFIETTRAYVAPDRKWEQGRYGTAQETIEAEIVQLGTKFFRRVGTQPTWQRLEWPGGTTWPGDEFRFPGAYHVAWVGPGESNGRAARILSFQHAGSVEQRNAGWEFHTQLWLDPQTHYLLQRVTTGRRAADGATPSQRFEGTWTYTDHNAAITIQEPPTAGRAP
jgi:hypothetical protein